MGERRASQEDTTRLPTGETPPAEKPGVREPPPPEEGAGAHAEAPGVKAQNFSNEA